MSTPARELDRDMSPERTARDIPFSQGLTFRQAATTLLVVLVFGLLAAGIELYSDWKAMRGEIRTQTERTLQLVEGSAAEAAYQFNETLAQRVVTSLSSSEQIDRVVLRDNFGRVFAEHGRIPDSEQAGRLQRSLFGDLTEHAQPLFYRNGEDETTEVGELAVTLSADAIASSFMQRGMVIVMLGLIKVLGISALVVLIFYFMITRPLLRLHASISQINPKHPGDWPRPHFRHHDNDELGRIVGALDQLMQAFQRGLEQRDQARDENMRLGAELDVSRRIQHILLPSRTELDAIKTLDIATYMEAAQEVGGDYYDILSHPGGVRIGIGDVTGHGLESGVVMLMTQSAVRTMLSAREEDIRRVMEVLNNTIYNNVQRMGCGKNLTLALLDYRSQATEDGQPGGWLRISGQHESVIVVRANGHMELIDTDELGFPIGLVEDMVEFVNETELALAPGDLVVLYTDGITEAADTDHRLYGMERLTEVISRHHHESAEQIKDAIVADVKRHIGTQTLYDDLTLVVLKQKQPA